MTSLVSELSSWSFRYSPRAGVVLKVGGLSLPRCTYCVLYPSEISHSGSLYTHPAFGGCILCTHLHVQFLLRTDLARLTLFRTTLWVVGLGLEYYFYCIVASKLAVFGMFDRTVVCCVTASFNDTKGFVLAPQLHKVHCERERLVVERFR